MSIDGHFHSEFNGKFQKFIEEGQDLSIAGEAISVSGSELFDEINKDMIGGKILFSKTKKECVQKLILI